MSVRPSDQEDEYFARQEFERRKAALAAQQGRAPEEERQRILAVARGRCPKCGAALVEVPYKGVDIDKCTGCGGVWLDVGELEKLAAGDKGLLGSLGRIFGS